MMVLFIKVARRGVATLDIYINKNKRGNDNGIKRYSVSGRKLNNHQT